MNIFTEVKEAVSAKEVASFYGLKVNRRGFCICPFHPDKHPSMKVDVTHYHCFGCGAHGDVVNLVADLYGLSQYEAAKRIINDMHLPVEMSVKENFRDTGPVMDKRRIEQKIHQAVALLVRNALQVLEEYHRLLLTWKREYAPEDKNSDFTDWHPLFAEALGNWDKINWMLDELYFSKEEEQFAFLTAYGEEIKRIENRIKDRQ